jgi:hypothetical protein
MSRRLNYDKLIIILFEYSIGYVIIDSEGITRPE